MRIAVYSGSFNPLHIGHLAIVRQLLEKEGFDKVYLVVSPKNPLKDNIDISSAPARLEAAREAVVRRGLQENVVVDDIEFRMPAPHYTVRTLDALREREPQNAFTLIMGSDQIADIRRWRDYGRILSEYGVLVYPREGFDNEAVAADLLNENPQYRIGIMDAMKVDVSSTMIREGLSRGEDMSPYFF